jgi:hypothetical protein
MSYSRSASLEESLKWRNKCASMLRRIRRITERPQAEEQRIESAIEEYSIQTGLDYDQSRHHVMELNTPTEIVHPNLLIQFLESAATPILPEIISGKKSVFIDPSFSMDMQLLTTRPVNRARHWFIVMRIAMYSNSLWMVILGCVLNYLVHQTIVPGLVLVAVVVGAVPQYPYTSSRFWWVVLLFQLLFVGAQFAWQLPSVCDAGTDKLRPWWQLFSLSQECAPVFTTTHAMQLGFTKWFDEEMWFKNVWSDGLLDILICIHLRSLFMSGRSLAAPSKIRSQLQMDRTDPSSDFEKPPGDFYTVRFSLSLFVVVFLIIDWSRISSTNLPASAGAPSLLGESVTRNHFSTNQVIAVTLFIFQMLLDRIMYSHSKSLVGRRIVLGLVTGQLFMLIFGMNLRVVYLFWFAYFSYLLLSARQLAFEIRPIASRSGILWSSGKFSYYAFRVYLVIPFLDELRQICDWVAAPVTALSLFMWFKVEDCMQNLRVVQAEMDSRKSALPMLSSDRACVGVATLMGLVAIITGPLVFFSGLNVLREPNLVVSGSPAGSLGFTNLRIFLEVPDSLPRIELYSSNQVVTSKLNPDWVKDDEVLAPLVALQSADLQSVSSRKLPTLSGVSLFHYSRKS